MSVVTPMLDSYDLLMKRAKEISKRIERLRELLNTLEKLETEILKEAEQIMLALEPLEKEADKKFGKKKR